MRWVREQSDADQARIAGLWADYRADPTVETRAALIEWYTPLLWQVAHSMRTGWHVDRRDLVQDGVFGLAHAIGRYDPANPERAPFEAYAWKCIRGAITEAARHYDWVPRVARDQTTQVDDATDNLRDEFGRWPTSHEVAARLGWTDRKLADVLHRQERVTQLPLLEAAEVEDGQPPVDTTSVDDDMARYLADTQARVLNVQTRLVLDLYYREGVVMRAIGDRIGVTEGRVCQIVNRGTRQLRALVGEHL